MRTSKAYKTSPAAFWQQGFLEPIFSQPIAYKTDSLQVRVARLQKGRPAGLTGRNRKAA